MKPETAQALQQVNSLLDAEARSSMDDAHNTAEKDFPEIIAASNRLNDAPKILAKALKSKCGYK